MDKIKHEKNTSEKSKKIYKKPKLISEQVFAVDAFGGCTLTSAPQGCGRGPYSSS